MAEKAKNNVDEHGFGQLDSRFIGKYLRHAEETLEDGKLRIKAEQEETQNVSDIGS